MKRHELTREQWKRIKPLLPSERGRWGRPAKPNLPMINGMVYILRTGLPWRDLPTKYGKWQSVWTRFSRWTTQGVWQRVLDEVAKDYDDSEVMIDATIVRAHQDSAGAKGKPRRRSARRVGA